MLVGRERFMCQMLISVKIIPNTCFSWKIYLKNINIHLLVFNFDVISKQISIFYKWSFANDLCSRRFSSKCQHLNINLSWTTGARCDFRTNRNILQVNRSRTTCVFKMILESWSTFNVSIVHERIGFMWFLNELQRITSESFANDLCSRWNFEYVSTYHISNIGMTHVQCDF